MVEWLTENMPRLPKQSQLSSQLWLFIPSYKYFFDTDISITFCRNFAFIFFVAGWLVFFEMCDFLRQSKKGTLCEP